MFGFLLDQNYDGTVLPLAVGFVAYWIAGTAFRAVGRRRGFVIACGLCVHSESCLPVQDSR